MKRIANVRFEQLRDYSGKNAKPMRQNDGKRIRCGKMAESEADAAKWRKAKPMRQNGGKRSQCGKMMERGIDAAK